MAVALHLGEIRHDIEQAQRERQLLMAKVVGRSGRHLEQELEEKQRRVRGVIIMVFAVAETITGIGLGFYWGRRGAEDWTLALILAVFLAALLVCRLLDRYLDAQQRARRELRRRLPGEEQVGCKLEGLPSGFTVLHDVATGAGHVDHVVLGPTGVFLLDTKGWRGVVAADGKGELLLNGKPLDKPYVRELAGRVLGIKYKIRALAPKVDPYFQAAFAFTAAQVEAGSGSTGSVHCLRDEQLEQYIVENRSGRRLKDREIDTLGRAFAAVAHMEEGFDASEQRGKQPSNGQGNGVMLAGMPQQA